MRCLISAYPLSRAATAAFAAARNAQEPTSALRASSQDILRWVNGYQGQARARQAACRRCRR